jgi:hypothetical protein
MYAQCDDNDTRIIRYKRIAAQKNDQILQEGVVRLLAKLEADKATLHPVDEA